MHSIQPQPRQLRNGFQRVSSRTVQRVSSSSRCYWLLLLLQLLLRLLLLRLLLLQERGILD